MQSLIPVHFIPLNFAKHRGLVKGVEAIKNYQYWRRPDGLPVDESSYLLLSFPQQLREKARYLGMDKSVKAIAQLAGIPNAFTHRGRYTMATNLIMTGVDHMLAGKIT